MKRIFYPWADRSAVPGRYHPGRQGCEIFIFGIRCQMFYKKTSHVQDLVLSSICLALQFFQSSFHSFHAHLYLWRIITGKGEPPAVADFCIDSRGFPLPQSASEKAFSIDPKSLPSVSKMSHPYVLSRPMLSDMIPGPCPLYLCRQR